MSQDPLPQPHDRFFKETFRRPEHAAALFRGLLPKELGNAIAWESLQHKPATFLDEALRERASDLLFNVLWQGRDTLL